MTGRMLERAARQAELLDDVHRVQPHVLPDAHPRVPRHAATRLHVPLRARLGRPEHARHHRLVRVRVRHAAHARATSSGAGAAASPRPPTRGTPTHSSGRPPRRRPITTSPRSRSWPAAIRCGTSPDPCRSRRRATTGRRRALGVEGALDKETPLTRASRADRGHTGDPVGDLPAVRARGRRRGFFVGLLVEAPMVGVVGVVIAGVGLLRWMWRTGGDLR